VEEEEEEQDEERHVSLRDACPRSTGRLEWQSVLGGERGGRGHHFLQDAGAQGCPSKKRKMLFISADTDF
jgi:hypothetical protein